MYPRVSPHFSQHVLTLIIDNARYLDSPDSGASGSLVGVLDRNTQVTAQCASRMQPRTSSGLARQNTTSLYRVHTTMRAHVRMLHHKNVRQCSVGPHGGPRRPRPVKNAQQRGCQYLPML